MVEQLSIEEMLDITGGISREEYCKTIMQLANAQDDSSWTSAQWDSWADAWEKHCG